MAVVTARSRNPAGHAGLIDNVVGFVSAFYSFIETRAALLASESKGVLLQLIAVVAFGLGALIAVIFGYVFLLVAIIFAIAHAAGVSWTWIALIVGLLHLALAVACVFLAKSKLHGRLYAETRAELKKDQEWLKSLGKTAPR